MKTTFKILACVSLFAGTVIAKDTKIDVTELPAQVTDAVMQAHPGATLLSAEVDKKLDGQIDNYEVEINHGGKKLELKLSPDGTIQKQDN